MAYITAQDLQNEGVAARWQPEWLQQRIALAQQLIDQATGLFFEARTLTMQASGRGHDFLWLAVPPVKTTSITEVRVDGEIIASTGYRVVMPVFPDGRFNPKLVRLHDIWPKGDGNVEIVGTFGFVDVVAAVGETPESYVAPEAIRHVCKRIAIYELPQLGNADAQRSKQIVQESLKDYSYRLSEAISRNGVFGDPDIDNTLTNYRPRFVGGL